MSNIMFDDGLFRSYFTKKFSDFWDSADEFYADWNEIGPFRGCLGDTLINDVNVTEEERIKLIFYLLYAQYGNSHIANLDETQFKLRLWSTIFQYAPTWNTKLKYQAQIRALTDNEILIGATNVYNHSYNPSTAPSTQSLDELTTIDDQNVTKFKKSKLEAYFQATQYLEQDFTKEFIDRFKVLFLKIVEGQEPLYYNEIEDDTL